MKTPLIILIALAGLLTSPSAAAEDDDISEACADAGDSARAAASELATYARRLEICADDEDFDDDCSSDFRRVESAQADYESAVSEVANSCD